MNCLGPLELVVVKNICLPTLRRACTCRIRIIKARSNFSTIASAALDLPCTDYSSIIPLTTTLSQLHQHRSFEESATIH